MIVKSGLMRITIDNRLVSAPPVRPVVTSKQLFGSPDYSDGGVMRHNSPAHRY